MDNLIKKYLSEIGSRGGSAKTSAKTNASRRNFELARRKLAEKRAENKLKNNP